MKIINYYNGNIVGQVDNRTLQEEKNLKIELLREYTTYLIRSKIDMHEELNCANGLYDNEIEKKQFILNWLTECRNFYLNKKTEILGCSTLNNLDNIYFKKDS